MLKKRVWLLYVLGSKAANRHEFYVVILKLEIADPVGVDA